MKCVGKYKINMKALLAEGLVKVAGKGIRLRFQRTEKNIEIAINRSGPSLIIGSKP